MSFGSETLTAGTQSDTKGTGIASESGHWYYQDGRPCYTITGKNGKERSPFIKEALSMELVPGTTTIIGQISSYALQIYGKKQTAWSALTIPRQQGETDEDFVNRIIVESGEHARIAADKGKELHGAIEKAIQGKDFDIKWREHVEKVIATLAQHGIDAFKGRSEHTFSSPLGYGGKMDFWSGDPWFIDFKSKERIEPKKQLAWDNHIQQLAAYGFGVGCKKFRAANCFVGIDDMEIRFVEHEWSNIEAAYGQFLCLLDYWQRTKKFGKYRKQNP